MKGNYVIFIRKSFPDVCLFKFLIPIFEGTKRKIFEGTKRKYILKKVTVKLHILQIIETKLVDSFEWHQKSEIKENNKVIAKKPGWELSG